MTVFGITATLTACGSLNLQDGIDNVFTYETNLDDGQQSIVDDIETTFADAADELLEPEEGSEQGQGMGMGGQGGPEAQGQGGHGPRGPKGIFHRGFPVDWMIDYIEGGLDTAGVLASIQEKQAEKTVRIEQREAELLDLLESFSEEQAEQFLSNLDERQARIEERQGDMEREDRPEPGDMFGDLNLTEEQQAEVDALLEDMREDRVAGPEGQRELIEAFLSGEKTREEVEAEFEVLRNERHQDHLERASEWLEFLDTLSAEQQSTLLATLEEIQERHEQRCSEMEDDFGSPPEQGEEGGSEAGSEQGEAPEGGAQ